MIKKKLPGALDNVVILSTDGTVELVASLSNLVDHGADVLARCVDQPLGKVNLVIRFLKRAFKLGKKFAY